MSVARNSFSILVIIFILLSCGTGNKENNSSSQEQPGEKEQPGDDSKSDASKIEASVFDINSLEVSEADLGDIPFFTLPKNTAYLNKPLQRDYDEIFFPLIKDKPLEKIGGTSFKAYVSKDKNTDWSQAYFLKSYDEAISAAGGKLVFEGRLSKEQLTFLTENASYLGEEGSIDYWNEPVRTYVIRRPSEDHIYFQLYANSSSGAIQVLQREAFKQTITLLKADQIKKELDEKGKAVLHINFDTDKATLKPDGLTAIKEIVKVLTTEKDLKTSINGYTDNVGGAEHNQTLSEERAQTVKNELIKAGINADRLTAKGFGQDNPIADNGTEDGKAQNRRVELVKQ